jgi:hypothetical protein
MAVVTTEFKRVFNSALNRAHTSLQDSVLPLEIQLDTEPSLPTIMSTQQSNGSVRSWWPLVPSIYVSNLWLPGRPTSRDQHL